VYSIVLRDRKKLEKIQKSWDFADFKDSESGTTAIEFGFVALPFFLMVFLIINSALFWYAQNSLDKGIADATRQVLTGTAQNTNMTVAGFQSLVCQQANLSGSYIDCSKLRVIMASSTVSWADLAAKQPGSPCLSSGKLGGSTGAGTDLLSVYTGNASTYIWVTACYQWELSRTLPKFAVGPFSDGAMLIQSTMAFKSEPYS